MKKKYFVSRNGLNRLFEKKISIQNEMIDTQKRMGESTKIDNDLRENPEYMQLAIHARDVLPRQLAEIDDIILNSVIFEESPSYINSAFFDVQIGSKVELQNISNQGEVGCYVIGGFRESDTKKKIIGYDTPIGNALLRKKLGDIVEVKIPAGLVVYKILSISKGYPLP